MEDDSCPLKPLTAEERESEMEADADPEIAAAIELMNKVADEGLISPDGQLNTGSCNLDKNGAINIIGGGIEIITVSTLTLILAGAVKIAVKFGAGCAIRRLPYPIGMMLIAFFTGHPVAMPCDGIVAQGFGAVMGQFNSNMGCASYEVGLEAAVNTIANYVTGATGTAALAKLATTMLAGGTFSDLPKNPGTPVSGGHRKTRNHNRKNKGGRKTRARKNKGGKRTHRR